MLEAETNCSSRVSAGVAATLWTAPLFEQAQEGTSQSVQHWERNPDTVRRLQKMYAEVSEFNRRAFALMNGPDDEFQKLSNEVDAWSKENRKWILDNMSLAAYYRVIKNPGPLPAQVSGNQKRGELSVVLQIMQQNLGQLVESSAWDKR